MGLKEREFHSDDFLMKGRLENLKLQLDQDSLSLFIIFGSFVAWIPNFNGCFEKYHVKRNNAEVSKLLYLLAPSIKDHEHMRRLRKSNAPKMSVELKIHLVK